MTVSNTEYVKTFTGDGSTKTIPFNFHLLAPEHLTVTVDGAEKHLGTDYTIDGVGEDDGGSVTFTVAPPANSAVKLERLVDLLQQTSILNRGVFYPKVHEYVFDKLTMAIQQLARGIASPGTDAYQQIVDIATVLSNAKSEAAFEAAVNDSISRISEALASAEAYANSKAAEARATAVADINEAVGGVVPNASDAADAVSKLLTLANNSWATANNAASAAANAATIQVFSAPANLPPLPSANYPAKFGPVMTSSDWSLWKVNDAGSAWDRILFASTGIFGKIIASQIQVDDTLRAAVVSAAIVMTQLLTVLPDSTDTGSGTVQIGGGTIRAGSILAKNLTVANFDNLIPNPNSEQAAPAGGWPAGAYEAAGLHTGDAYSGTKCRINTGGDLFVTGLIPVEAGQAYYFEGQVSISSSSGYAYIILTAHNASGGYVGNVGSSNARNTADGYALCKGSGTVAAGTAFIRVDLYVVNCTATFDALTLRRMSDANLIVDGTLQALFARIARAIQSTNYVAGSAGNSPVGFCLSSTPFTTTFKDGTTDSGCLMEVGGSGNFGGYKVATINTQVMTAINRIVNGSFWMSFSPWSAQPRFVYTITANPYQNIDYYGTNVVASQSFSAPGYTTGTIRLKFTPSATFVLNSGEAASPGPAGISFRVTVYMKNHYTGTQTTLYQQSASAVVGSPWSPGQQSINVTSLLSTIPAGYGVAAVIDNIYIYDFNGSNARSNSYTGTIDVTGFELIF